MTETGVHRLNLPRTAEQIAERRFRRTWRGYDIAEVEAFLREVSEDYRRVLGLNQWAIENGGSRSIPETREALDRLGERVEELSRLVEGLTDRAPARATTVAVTTEDWWPREAPIERMTRRRATVS